MIRIKLFIISAGAAPAIINEAQKEYICKFDEGYAQRFIKHLSNDGELCTACNEDCVSCRLGAVEDLSGRIDGHLKLPLLTNQFIDEPEEYLQGELAPHDITVAINIHSDLLIELPDIVASAGSKALIVPVEDPDWLGNWTKSRLEEKCRSLGLEFAAPKPFCNLTGDGHIHIKRFIKEFKVGRPEIDFTVEEGVIKRVDVITSAPCGATYYLAHIMEGLKADNGLIEVACKGLSSFPCTASTKVDPEFKDSITHKANYIMMDVLKNVLRS